MVAEAMDIPNGKEGFRRIQLACGMSLDFIFFEPAGSGPAWTERNEEAEQPRKLHECSRCGSELVYPLEWDEAGENAWSVTLRCPSCELIAIGLFTQAEVDAFDTELDRGTKEVMNDLERLARANMADDVDRFAAALWADAVLPVDF
jgi:hypothetical protein